MKTTLTKRVDVNGVILPAGTMLDVISVNGDVMNVAYVDAYDGTNDFGFRTSVQNTDWRTCAKCREQWDAQFLLTFERIERQTTKRALICEHCRDDNAIEIDELTIAIVVHGTEYYRTY